MAHIGNPRRVGEPCSNIFDDAFGHSFAHSVYAIPKFHFASDIHWVLPETAFLEGFPVSLIVLSPPDVVLYMSCSKAKVFSTVGTYTGSLPTIKTHRGITILLLCCRDNKRNMLLF